MPRSTVNLSPKKGEDWTVPFLADLRNTANVRSACKVAKISRQVAYQKRADDKEFAAAWQSALDDATDQLEKVARDRAIGTSDTLLIFLLKSHRPDVYRESFKVVGSGKDGELVVKILGSGAPVEEL